MTTMLCPMCGRPVKMLAGRIASHRSYTWNQDGTRLMVCQASGRDPDNVARAMTPDLRSHYRAERVAFLRSDKNE